VRVFAVIPLLLSGCVSSASLALAPAERRLVAQRRAVAVERAQLFEAENELDAREIAALSTYVGLIAMQHTGSRVVARGLAADRVLSARILRNGERCLLGLALPIGKWGRLEPTACDLSSMYRAAERAVSTLPKAEETKR